MVNASESDSDSDNSDDESEEEHGDAFHKLHDGWVYCMCLIWIVMFSNVWKSFDMKNEKEKKSEKKSACKIEE